MRINELIKKLIEYRKKYGNIEVYAGYDESCITEIKDLAIETRRNKEKSVVTKEKKWS